MRLLKINTALQQPNTKDDDSVIERINQLEKRVSELEQKLFSYEFGDDEKNRAVWNEFVGAKKLTTAPKVWNDLYEVVCSKHARNSDSTVLDFECGSGSKSFFSSKGYRYIGVDFLPSSYSELKLAADESDRNAGFDIILYTPPTHRWSLKTFELYFQSNWNSVHQGGIFALGMPGSSSDSKIVGYTAEKMKTASKVVEIVKCQAGTGILAVKGA